MKKIILAGAVAALVAAGPGTAQADSGWCTAGKVLTGVAIGAAVTCALAPCPPPAVIVTPAPVVVQPTPVVVQHVPVVVQPAPVVVQQPVVVQTPVYAPPPVTVVPPPVVYMRPAPMVYACPAPALIVPGGYRHGYRLHPHSW